MSASMPRLAPGQPADLTAAGANEPVFAEPWHAEAYAIVLALTDAGHASWPEWVDQLSAAIASHQAGGDPDLGDTYYDHWLAALEQLCVAKGLLSRAALDAREEEWRAAYLRTPHGEPVLLEG